MITKLLKIPAFGQSMYPFFHSGDILFIQPISLQHIQINDFITFKKKSILITHRVIYIPLKKNYLITKGDTNLAHDGKIKPEQIIGKVIKVKRNEKTYTPDTIYQFQSLLYANEIEKINTLFQKKGIDFVFLKGLPLHLYYEKEIPKRIYADCDILIEKKQLLNTDQLLRNLGYTSHDDTLSKGHTLLKNKENAINYYKRIHGISITFDIHLEASFMMHQLGSLDGLYPQKLLDLFTQDLLLQKRIITIDTTTYPILSSTHITIYLALHLFHHNFQGYYRYEFLNTVLQKEKITMSKLTSCLQTYRLQSFVYPVFFLLWKYYQNSKAKQILNVIDISESKLEKIKNQTKKIDIFSDDSRIEGGIKRFYLLFLYSPQNILKKLSVFISLPVLYSILWVGIKKLKYYQTYAIYQLKRSF